MFSQASVILSIWRVGVSQHALGREGVADTPSVVDLGGHPWCAPPMAQNFLNFMQFFAKFGKIICWRPPGGLVPLLWGILDPPLPLGRHPTVHTPPGQTRPWADTPQADIPLGRHPLARHHPPNVHCSTHPTGMHSCFL